MSIKRVSVIMSMEGPARTKTAGRIASPPCRGVVAPFAFKGAMNDDTFAAYAETQLAPEPQPGDIVFVDGLGSHRTRAARAAIEARGAQLRILPPYSPDLTPVEKCGAKVKDVIRGMAPRTVSAVIDAMGEGIGTATQQT